MMPIDQQRSALCQEIRDTNFLGSARDGKYFWAAAKPGPTGFQMQVIICACCGNYQNVHHLTIYDVAIAARCYDDDHIRLTQDKVNAATRFYDEHNI